MSSVLENVKKWELRRGKKELVQHLEGGKHLTYKQAVVAKCYECNCGFPSGAADCKVPACPLYGFMPFRTDKPSRPTNGRVMTKEQKDKLAAGKVRKAGGTK